MPPKRKAAGAVASEVTTKKVKSESTTVVTDKKEDPTTVVAKKSVICAICNNVYSDTSHLNQHIRSAHDNVRFTCQEKGCGKDFPTKSNLTRHTKSVHDNLKYICQEKGCGKEFPDKSNLNRHTKSAHDIKYACQEQDCGQEFPDKTSLTQHTKSAHDSARYICQEKGCGHEFSKKDHLDRHVKSAHENFKYICQEKGCGKDFSYKWDLNQHMESAHEKIKYICQEKGCGQEFSRKQHLDRHIKSAHASPEEAAELVKKKDELQRILADKERRGVCSGTKSCENPALKDSFRCAHHQKSVNVVEKVLEEKRESGTLSASSIQNPAGFELLLQRPQVTLDETARLSLQKLAQALDGVQSPQAFFIDVEFVWGADRYIPLDLTVMRANGEEIFSDRIDYNMSVEALHALCPQDPGERSFAMNIIRKVYGRAGKTWGKTPDQAMKILQDARISSDAIF